MTAYLITLRKGPVKDPEAMAEYQKRTRQMKGEFKMVPRIIYGATEGLEGTPPDGVVMLEFPSMEEARAWYNNPEYQEAVPFRQKAADYEMFIVEGINP